MEMAGQAPATTGSTTDIAVTTQTGTAPNSNGISVAIQAVMDWTTAANGRSHATNAMNFLFTYQQYLANNGGASGGGVVGQPQKPQQQAGAAGNRHQTQFDVVKPERSALEADLRNLSKVLLPPSLWTQRTTPL